MLTDARIRCFQELKKELTQCSQFISLKHKSNTGKGSIIAWDARGTPDGGHYAYLFLKLIEKHERKGKISPERSVILETTTGTAGRGLAYVAARLGYSLVVFMPEPAHPKREIALRDLLGENSELILTPQGKYIAGAVREFRKFLIRHRKFGYNNKAVFPLNHARDIDSVSALEELLDENWSEFDLNSYVPDIVVAALGNGAFSTAFFRHFSRIKSKVRTIGIEPIEAPSRFVMQYGEQALKQKYDMDSVCKAHDLPGTGGWNIKFPLHELFQPEKIRLFSSKEVTETSLALLANEQSYGRTSSACWKVASSSVQYTTSIAAFPIYDSYELYK